MNERAGVHRFHVVEVRLVSVEFEVSQPQSDR